MLSFFEALVSNPLLMSAVLAGFAASVCSGIVGSYVVVKRIVFISGSISHSVLAGMGLCLWLQRAKGVESVTPLQGALVTAILSALIIGWVHLYYKEREDSVIAALWSVGTAIGVLFISQTPGYNVELTNLLIGNILWVAPSDLWVLFGLDVLVVIAVIVLHRRFLAICFDEEQAKLQGQPVKALYMLLLVLVAVTTVLLIQVVGIILVLTMLTIPAAIANLFTSRLTTMMLLGVGLNALFSFSGTVAAYHLDWPVGATIALLSGVAYAAILTLRRSPIHRS